jgi:3-oxoacyl-[acyl-carrier-protein] synthase II
MSQRRVVVTGLGLVCPLGSGVDHVWPRLLNGESGIGQIDHFDISDQACHIAGCVPINPDIDGHFDWSTYLSPREHKKMDNFSVFGLSAATQAVEQAGLMAEGFDPNRAGVLMGSGIGGLETLQKGSDTLLEKGPRRLSPFFIPATLINILSGLISIKYNFRGPCHTVATACSSGTHAIGDAYRLIAYDDADIMVCGSAEAPITSLGMAGFSSLRALSTSYNDRPTEASRPWDKNRDGFVMGEGSGALVLEELSHAQKRGAKIYGEIVGYGLSGDAHHMTATPEDGNGAARAMGMALKRAGINPSDVGYVNAHGTSTPVGDGAELAAARSVFGSSLSDVAMSSTKSAIGHLLGGAGSVEAVFTLKALETGCLPPTLNLHDPMDTDINLVPLTAQEKSIKYAVSNSFGFGGTNSSLVLKAFL